MTTDDTAFPRLLGESSRRTFMKRGTVAAGALGLGLGGGATASAQDGNQTVFGLIPQGQFRGGAQFRIVSDAIGYAPVQQDTEGQEYATRVIKYTGAPGNMMLFVPQNANLQQGQTYQFLPQYDPAFDQQDGDGPGFDQGALDRDLVYDDPLELGLLLVRFRPVQGGGQQGGNQTAGNQTAGNQTDG
ncbi:hypothetical protein DMJ13_00085 [halophilic archaeon]|nr:hypothetical protein DMJ13_00085 [halophilic archaeon]